MADNYRTGTQGEGNVSEEISATGQRAWGNVESAAGAVTGSDSLQAEGSRDINTGDKALEGAGAGSAIGGTVGAVLAAIAAIGTSIVIPGLGLVVAGPIAAALAGAGAGGLTGGLIGALVGSGIPEDRAKEYDEGIRNGGMVMGVNPRNDEDAGYFEQEFRNNRGESVYR
jgi:uncharacterized protein YjbJ (UPF0337 family)